MITSFKGCNDSMAIFHGGRHSEVDWRIDPGTNWRFGAKDAWLACRVAGFMFQPCLCLIL